MSQLERSDARKELWIHKTIIHPYIVKYEAHFEEKWKINIILEYMDGLDLGVYIKK